MKATITSIELKDPFKFFALSASALSIIKQLKSTNYLEFKKKGDLDHTLYHDLVAK